MLEFVQCDKALVVQPRQSRFERRQRLCEEPKRGMTIRLTQCLVTEACNLPGVGFRIDRRAFARRATESGAVRVQHD